LYDKITTKTFHKKLYKGVSNDKVSIKDSSIWLKHGNIPAKREAALCFLQDRNMFLGEIKKCPHCGNAPKTVDHLASKCEKMLGTDYTRRHNEVLKCIHLLLCNKYGVKSTKKLRNHSVQEIISNKYVEIRVDTFVKTDIKIKHNRPDIIVIDKRTKEILIIEVGITSLDNLQQVETEKLRKYDVLANELTQMHGFKSTIVPYVLTWDGVVSIYHEMYRRRLELSVVSHTTLLFFISLKNYIFKSLMEKQGELNFNKTIVSIIELFLGNEYDTIQPDRVLHSVSCLEKGTGRNLLGF
jgi:hypothetical protein